MKPTVYVTEPTRFWESPRWHDSHVGNFTGRMAVKLAEHFGVIAAMPDGYDATGRQKLRLLTPQEAVARAYAIAVEMTEMLVANDDLVAVPPPLPSPPADATAGGK